MSTETKNIIDANENDAGYRLEDLEAWNSERGKLISFIKAPGIGQIYCLTILPGQVRGNHYHAKKEETIMVYEGRCKIYLEDSKTKEKSEIILDSSDESQKKIIMQPYIVHTFENIGDATAMLVEYASTVFDESDPDIIKYEGG